jgi:hypothetical protein
MGLRRRDPVDGIAITREGYVITNAGQEKLGSAIVVRPIEYLNAQYRYAALINFRCNGKEQRSFRLVFREFTKNKLLPVSNREVRPDRALSI